LSSKAAVLFAPDKATDLAHEALIRPGDLPGEWQIRDDDFADDLTIARLGSCSETLAVQKAEADSRAGRASRVFGRVIIGDAAFRISGIVDVYRTEDAAQKALEKRRELEASDAGVTCYAAVAKEGVPSLAVKATRGTVIGNTVSGGNSSAIDLEVGNSSQTVVIHLELQHWARSNAVITVVVSGGKEAVTADAVNTAVEKQKEALEVVASGKK
jgi:hypothetical protein